MLGKLFGNKKSSTALDESIQQAVDAALVQVKDPYLNTDLKTLGVTVDGALNNGLLSLQLTLPYPANGLTDQLQQALEPHLTAVDGISALSVQLSCDIAEAPASQKNPSMQGVRNIIAVASGKGGVGKSTTTVNLALAMASEGARVGILDADIYGPSLAQMLGVAEGERPDSSADEKFFIPIERHGVQSMSMAYLVDENTPMVWRGPMVSGAMQQLLTQTKWTDLDYLFIDMPPGTGDIQLTLSQKVPVSGSVVVTTPQDIALLDAVKGIEMFRKVDIPVLGIVENMSVHICSNCGHAEHIFGEGGGEKVAQQYETTMLGSLPLTMDIRQQADQGVPLVVADADSPSAGIYRDIARKLAAGIVQRRLDATAGMIPTISISDD